LFVLNVNDVGKFPDDVRQRPQRKLDALLSRLSRVRIAAGAPLSGFGSQQLLNTFAVVLN
jgi:hypothetical protein